MSTDAELLQRYVRGRDDGAFAELVQRHLPVLFAAAVRRAQGRADLAEEAVQQVFCDLARKSGALMHHESLIGWLYRSVRYTVIDALRADARRQRLLQHVAQLQPESPDTAEPLAGETLRPWLDAAMDELRPGDREIVLMRFFYTLSFGEIGRRLGVAENTARMRTERSLERLRGLLARRGVRSSAAALAVALGHEACASTPAGMSLAMAQAALAVGPAQGAAAALAIVFMGKYTLPAICGFLAVGVTAVVWTTAFDRVDAADLHALRADQERLQQTAATHAASAMSSVAVQPDPDAQAVAIGEMLMEQRTQRQAATAANVPGTQAQTRPVSARGHSDHGNATPEAAALTFAWACDIADPVELARLVTFDPDGRAAALEVLAGMPEAIRAQYPTCEDLFGMLLAASCLEAPPPGADVMQKFMSMVELQPGRFAARKLGSERNVHEYQQTENGWKYVLPAAGVRGLPSLLNSDTLARLGASESAAASTP